MKLTNITYSKGRGFLEIDDGEKGKIIFSFHMGTTYAKKADGSNDYDKQVEPNNDDIFEKGEQELTTYLAANLFKEYKTLKKLKK